MRINHRKTHIEEKGREEITEIKREFWQRWLLLLLFFAKYFKEDTEMSNRVQKLCFYCPMPPLKPRDPFLSKLASVAAASPDLLKISRNSDTPPYLDLFDSPKLMASPAQVERSVSYNEHRPRKPPPDFPSLLLHGRIVYIGMPLVPAVTELVISELLYLQCMDPKEPIYPYISIQLEQPVTTVRQLRVLPMMQ